jgi:PKD repeat protein
MTNHLYTTFCLSLAVMFLLLPNSRAQEEDILLKFSHIGKIKEDRVHNFAVLYERPLHTDNKGYSPRSFIDPSTGAYVNVPTTYEQTVSFWWTFGDMPIALSSGERPVAQHIFREPGEHKVTVSMYVGLLKIKTVSKTFTVHNMPIRIRDLTAIRSPEADGTFEFATRTVHALPEDLTYEWDFGDDEKEITTEPFVKHQFKLAGTYPVKLVVKDAATEDEVDKTVTVAVYGQLEETAAPQTSDPEDEPVATAASTQLDATLTGSINDTMAAEIRPFAGIYLGPHRDGCRFMMNAWDRKNLLVMTLIADVQQFTPEAHRFTVTPATVQLAALSNGEDFQKAYSSAGNSLLPINATVGDDGQGIIQAGQREQQPYAEGPIATSSPFDLTEDLGVEYRSGTVTLDIKAHDRIEASMDLTLASDSDQVSLKGTFVLDLQTAVRDGIVLYKCAETEIFEVKRVKPKGDLKLSDRQPVEVFFNDEFDPSTATLDNIQVGYPDSSPEGNFQRITGRLMKDPKRILFVPNEPWRSGVRYTLRIRAEDNGLRSRAGGTLKGAGTEGWYEKEIWSELDFTLVNGGNLGSHVFQSVRDAPLIKGKPIMWRIYASWPKFQDVARYAQTETFTARIAGAFGYDHINATQTFVRPDLWEERGVNKANADHTANVFGFTPKVDEGFYLYQFKVERFENGNWVSRHRVTCPGQYWKHSPTLKVDWYMAPIGSWADGGHEDLVVYGERVMERAALGIWQKLPFAKVVVEYRGLAPLLEDPAEGVHCEDLDDALCAIKNLAYPPIPNTGHLGPDMIVCFLPEGNGAGNQLKVATIDPSKSRIWKSKYRQIADPDYPGGIVSFPLSKDTILGDWNSAAVPHEVGHALYLPHRPALELALELDDTAPAMDSMREERRDRTTFTHLGIEGFALAADGMSGFNKSSTEGNGESGSLTTMMFPMVLLPSQMFIAPDNYRKVMETIENGPGLTTSEPQPPPED